MPYGGTTPKEDVKIDHCIEKLKKQYPDWDESRLIATCKKSVMKNEDEEK